MLNERTDGPWTVEQKRGEPFVRADNGEAIADFAPTGSYFPRCWGNAQLAAAAPEMLETLELFLTVDTDEETNAAEAKARAIISKAKGEGC